MNKLGFIILRHVNSIDTNKYWIECYKSIRIYHPECNIVIIDDNSNYDYLTDEELYKTTVINSEYPGRGELLPYYYFSKTKFFDTAIIIHDSVFIQKHIDIDIDNNFDKYKMIWEFEHKWDQINDEEKMIKVFNDSELLEFYLDKSLWKGCFGGMSIISHDFLILINNLYDISKLLDVVLTRYNRCSFERVIACLLQKNGEKQVLLGDIHKYCKWGIKYDERDKYNDLPLIKVWTGR